MNIVNPTWMKMYLDADGRKSFFALIKGFSLLSRIYLGLPYPCIKSFKTFVKLLLVIIILNV